MAAAQRVLDSVGSDGLLPSSAIVEEAARRCHEIADIPAWPGWRWLAHDDIEAAAAFAKSRPEIASGVVVAHPNLVDPAVTAIGELDIDVALWVGAVTSVDMALAGHGDAEHKRTSCSHIGASTTGGRAGHARCRTRLPRRGRRATHGCDHDSNRSPRPPGRSIKSVEGPAGRSTARAEPAFAGGERTP